MNDRSPLSDRGALEDLLEDWCERGWLRDLDLALGRFFLELDPDASPPVLLAAVLASHQLGRGHICLDLDAVLRAPEIALSLPPDNEFGAPDTPRPAQLLADLDRDTWLGHLNTSRLVASGDGAAPLVLEPGSHRLYLYRPWGYECAVAAHLQRRLQADPPPIDGLGERLDELFTPATGDTIDWQKVACALMARRSFGIITGGPGTGKTTTVVKLLGLLQGAARDDGRPLRIRLAAPTGKAAARLTEAITDAVARLPDSVRDLVPREASTLHRLLGSRPDSRGFAHDARNPLHADLVVVDEASMIDLEMMYNLLRALPPTTRLVLLGDKDQLASVEAGSVLGDLCEGADAGGYGPQLRDWLQSVCGGGDAQWQEVAATGDPRPLLEAVVMLRHSHRFAADSGIGNLARAINSGDTGRVAAELGRGYADLDRFALPDGDTAPLRQLVLDGGSQPASGDTAPPGYRRYLALIRSERPGPGATADQLDDWAQRVLTAFSRFRLLTSLRRGPWGVEGLNQQIAGWLHRAGLIERQEGWYEGRPVLITRNDYALGLMNGDIGVTLSVPDDAGEPRLRVVFTLPDGSLKWLLPSRLQSLETVYAMTVHKSQGSEFQHTALVLPPAPNPVLTRELIYTGVTRASRWFTLVETDPRRLPEAVPARVRRASGLRERLTAGAPGT